MNEAIGGTISWESNVSGMPTTDLMPKTSLLEKEKPVYQEDKNFKYKPLSLGRHDYLIENRKEPDLTLEEEFTACLTQGNSIAAASVYGDYKTSKDQMKLYRSFRDWLTTSADSASLEKLGRYMKTSEKDFITKRFYEDLGLSRIKGEKRIEIETMFKKSFAGEDSNYHLVDGLREYEKGSELVESTGVELADMGIRLKEMKHENQPTPEFRYRSQPRPKLFKESTIIIEEIDDDFVELEKIEVAKEKLDNIVEETGRKYISKINSLEHSAQVACLNLKSSISLQETNYDNTITLVDENLEYQDKAENQLTKIKSAVNKVDVQIKAVGEMVGLIGEYDNVLEKDNDIITIYDDEETATSKRSWNPFKKLKGYIQSRKDE